MPDITHLYSVALVKKKGNKLYVVSDPEGVADESPIIAEGTTTPRMLTERFADTVNVCDFGAQPDQDCSSEIVAASQATTGTVVFPNGDFVATVTTENSAAILGVLSRVQINGTLTLTIASGTHVLTKPVVVASSVANGLRILGVEPVGVSITGQVNVTGEAGNYSVTLSVSSVADVSVGDFLHTFNVTGTGTPEVHRGGWEITAVNTDSNQITVRNTVRCSSFPTNTITSSESKVIKSVLKFNNCDGFVVRGSNVNLINNLAIVGNSDDYWSSSDVEGTEKGTHGLLIGAVSVALNGKEDATNPYGVSLGHVSCGRYVCVSGFDQQGIVVELNGSFFGEFVSSCNNKRRGFYASTAAGIRAKHISANGNYLDGCITDIGGQMYSSSHSCAIGNGQRGVSATSGGSIIFDEGIASYNGTQGAGAANNGYIQANSARFEFNVLDGAYAEYNSEVYAHSSKINSNSRNGLYASVTSVIRANNSEIKNNSGYAVRSNEFSIVFYTGATVSDNTNGEFYLRNNALVCKDIYYGSSLTGSDVVFKNATTNNGGQLSVTSGGDTFVFSFDTSASGSFTVGYRLRANTEGFTPEADGTQKLGRASNRWSEVFASTAAINTSDYRCKQNIANPTQALLKAWGNVGFKVFQFKDAVEKKGESSARYHVGVIAQDVQTAFTEQGLDASKYGLFCHDSWEDEYETIEVVDQPEVLNEAGEVVTPAVVHTEQRKVLDAGDRYGVRYEEALALECAYLRDRLSIIETVLANHGITLGDK